MRPAVGEYTAKNKQKRERGLRVFNLRSSILFKSELIKKRSASLKPALLSFHCFFVFRAYCYDRILRPSPHEVDLEPVNLIRHIAVEFSFHRFGERLEHCLVFHFHGEFKREFAGVIERL